MRKITNKPNITQRELANQLGHSLETNCVLKIKKRLLKIENLKKIQIN